MSDQNSGQNLGRPVEIDSNADRTLYAIDFGLDAPGTLVHEISADGLSLHSRYTPPDGGSAEARVSWESLEKAQANYENARQAAKRRVSRFAEAIDKAEPTTRSDSRIRYLRRGARGDLSVYTNVAPPTWWLPRAGLLLGKRTSSGRRQYGIRGGWLRVAVALTYTTKGQTKDQTTDKTMGEASGKKAAR